MKLPSLLSPPVLRAAEGEDEERSATWLELFFDLVFVVAIAQLAFALADDLSTGGFLRFGLLFIPVWWSWAGYTNYADRFDTDDVVFRVMILAGMLAMASLAVNVPEAFSGGSGAFAASYVAVRLVLILLYERARRHVPAARDLVKVTMSVFIVGTALWAVSIFVPEPYRFVLWGLALVIEVSTPWIARRAMASAPMHASHLPERYGLFTIIVLGESLVAIVLGLGDTDWQIRSALVAVAGFVAAASLWWVYFDFIDISDIKRGLLSRNVFIYGHLGIAAGLTATGVGVKKAILYADEGAFPVGAAWALCGGTTLFLIAVSLMYAVSIDSTRDRILFARVGAAAATLILAVVGSSIPTVLLVGLLLLTLLSLLAFEVVEKATRTAPTRTAPTRTAPTRTAPEAPDSESAPEESA